MSRRIFKTATIAMATVTLFFGALLTSVQRTSGATPKSKPQAALKFPKIPISLEIGRKKKGKCEFAFGICSIKIGIVAVEQRGRAVNAELAMTNDGKLQLTFLEKSPLQGKTLFVDEDITLSDELAQKLGTKSAVIRKGEYSFSNSKSVLNARLTR